MSPRHRCAFRLDLAVMLMRLGKVHGAKSGVSGQSSWEMWEGMMQWVDHMWACDLRVHNIPVGARRVGEVTQCVNQ